MSSDNTKIELHSNSLIHDKKRLITIRLLQEDREKLKGKAKLQNKSLQRFCFDILMSNVDSLK